MTVQNTPGGQDNGQQNASGGEQNSTQATDHTNQSTEQVKDNNRQSNDTTSQQSTETTTRNDNKQTTESPTKTSDTNSVLDSNVVGQVEALVVEAGLNASEVAQVVSELEGAVTPEMMKKLVDTHGESIANLVANNLKSFHEKNTAAVKAREQAVYDQVQEAFEGVTEQSGEETWKELSGWAKDNIDTADRKEINELLAKGGLAAKLAVQELITAFKGSDQFQQPADLLAADNTSDDFGLKPLDKQGYDRELRKLLDAGHDYETSPEIKALDNRRLRGMKRGI